MKKYQKPFTVKDGRIVDKNNKEVRLWGINYYVPFNHNFVNLEEMGIDHFSAIDRDIEDFKRMGIDFIRMHIYEREITDMNGNICENRHTEIFDYLIEKLDEADIYVMITTMVWYNSAEFQKQVTDRYAYWNISEMQNFSFSNFYKLHEMVWNEDALKAEETYLCELFTRKNAFSGKTLPEYDNIAVIEILNESAYPTAELICNLRKEKPKTTFAAREYELVTRYKKYLAENSLPDEKQYASKFCANLVSDFLYKNFGIVEKYFGKTVIRSQIHYMFDNKDIFECLKNAPIEAISVTAYAPNYFDTAYNDSFNVLSEMRKLYESYMPLKKLNKALVCYEFDTPTTLNSYFLGAFGYMLASLGVQMAAYFTYTPADVAAYNPGWIVHYMNLRHTANKAVALCAAGEIFRAIPVASPLSCSDAIWENELFEANKNADITKFSDGKILIHSNSTDEDFPFVPDKIIGVGSSKFVKREGNGSYFLEKLSDSSLSLYLLPDQFFVSDPFRGKAFRSMANRYVDTNRESVVSRLREKGGYIEINFPGFENYRVEIKKDGKFIPVKTDGKKFYVYEGEYLITKLQ